MKHEKGKCRSAGIECPAHTQLIMAWKAIVIIIIIIVVVVVVVVVIIIIINNVIINVIIIVIIITITITLMIMIMIMIMIIIVSGLPEERLQQGNREVGEHEGGILVGSQQAAPQQQLGILSSKGNLLQLEPFVAVAAAYCHHLQQSPHADPRYMQSSMLVFACHRVDNEISSGKCTEAGQKLGA